MIDALDKVLHHDDNKKKQVGRDRIAPVSFLILFL